MTEIIKAFTEDIKANQADESTFQVPIYLALEEEPRWVELLGEPNLIYEFVEGVGESDEPLAVGHPRRWQWAKRAWPVAMKGGPLAWNFERIKNGDVTAKGGPSHWEWGPVSLIGRIAEGPMRDESFTIHPAPPLELPTEDMSAFVKERVSISQL